MNRKESISFDTVIEGDGSELEKITAGFDYVTRLIIQHSHNTIELFRAEENHDAMVKEQIKMSTLKHARSILNTCYLRVIGKEVFDELID
ncbi:MAG: hypothetical protein K8R40_08710 [Anaerolineaceae bacterium]|nr:hypothetical protein [Anaerolineaceae bacterium]